MPDPGQTAPGHPHPAPAHDHTAHPGPGPADPAVMQRVGDAGNPDGAETASGRPPTPPAPAEAVQILSGPRAHPAAMQPAVIAAVQPGVASPDEAPSAPATAPAQAGAGSTPQPPALDWRDGVIPVSTRFDDPYFSIANGLEETRHVFLHGNGLPARFRPGFHIAELGFGTGLNMLAALIAWRAAGIPGPLRFTSFEAYPMQAPDIARTLRAFPEAQTVADPFLAQWAEGRTTLVCDGLEAQIILGDARSTLPAWTDKADAWFLDGFSPAKNPELWSDTLMQDVASHTAPQGTFATYTAAGHVRRALQAAGFQVERRPGHGTKRHMSAGWIA